MPRQRPASVAQKQLLVLRHGHLYWAVRAMCVQASALPDSNESEMQRRRWLAELATYWHHLLRAVAYTCVEPLAPVRDHALVVMHRCMDVAGESLKLPHETWGSSWRDILLPMLADLAGRMQARPPSPTCIFTL